MTKLKFRQLFLLVTLFQAETGLGNGFNGCLGMLAAVPRESAVYHLSMYPVSTPGYVKNLVDLHTIMYKTLPEAKQMITDAGGKGNHPHYKYDVMLDFIRYGGNAQIKLMALETLKNSLTPDQKFMHAVGLFPYLVQARFYERFFPEVRDAIYKFENELLPLIAVKGPLLMKPDVISPDLPADQRANILERINIGYSHDAKVTADVLSDAISKEVTELQFMRDQLLREKTSEDKRSALTRAYLDFLNRMNFARSELAEIRINQELTSIATSGNAQIIKVLPNGAVANDFHKGRQKDLSQWRPPFTPELPAFIIKAGDNFEVVRAYGGDAKVFGGFFSTGRLGEIWSIREARERLATPLMNQHLQVARMKVAKGDELVLGGINPQRSGDGMPMDNDFWSWGGGGGDAQYWRPDVHLVVSPGEKQPYLEKESVLAITNTINSDPELFRIQKKLYSNSIGFGISWWGNFQTFKNRLVDLQKLSDTPKWNEYHKDIRTLVNDLEYFIHIFFEKEMNWYHGQYERNTRSDRNASILEYVKERYQMYNECIKEFTVYVSEYMPENLGKFQANSAAGRAKMQKFLTDFGIDEKLR